jgi:hypothetical protein
MRGHHRAWGAPAGASAGSHLAPAALPRAHAQLPAPAPPSQLLEPRKTAWLDPPTAWLRTPL